MTICKLNAVAGAAALIIFSAFGFYLGLTFNDAYPEGGNHTVTLARFYLREFHSHGQPLALYNLLLSVLLPVISVSARRRALGSILGVLAFLLPLALLLKGVYYPADTFASLGFVGGASLIASAAILLAGALRGASGKLAA